nr:(2Fe-2S)-binding protein [Demequina litorisediminis]
MDDDATVCQCNTVSKGAICAAIADGCSSVDAVAKATRASTGCGDCRSQVARLIEATPTTKVPALAG